MSITDRKPLARIVPGGVLSESLDRRGTRKVLVQAIPGGVRVSISHSDGREFEHVIRCAA